MKLKYSEKCGKSRKRINALFSRLEGKAIVVEGKKDARALARLGFSAYPVAGRRNLAARIGGVSGSGCSVPPEISEKEIFGHWNERKRIPIQKQNAERDLRVSRRDVENPQIFDRQQSQLLEFAGYFGESETGKVFGSSCIRAGSEPKTFGNRAVVVLTDLDSAGDELALIVKAELEPYMQCDTETRKMLGAILDLRNFEDIENALRRFRESHRDVDDGIAAKLEKFNEDQKFPKRKFLGIGMSESEFQYKNKGD